jgi:hypothetical protein
MTEIKVIYLHPIPHSLKYLIFHVQLQNLPYRPSSVQAAKMSIGVSATPLQTASRPPTSDRPYTVSNEQESEAAASLCLWLEQRAREEPWNALASSRSTG